MSLCGDLIYIKASSFPQHGVGIGTEQESFYTYIKEVFRFTTITYCFLSFSIMDHETDKSLSWLPNFLNMSTKYNTVPDERTSLLPSPSDEQWSTGETYELDYEVRSRVQSVLQESWILLKGSLPVVLAYALQNSLQTVSVLIVGRLSPEALATAAFSYMFAMATGWLVALGGTTAIDTLASVSFTGSKNRHDLGIILQRSFVILLLLYIPIAIVWFCSEPLFKALGQEDYIARDSARFLSVLAPGGIGYIYFEALKKYMQAQGMLSKRIVMYARLQS
jgi:MATE family multidrug resistance protein